MHANNQGSQSEHSTRCFQHSSSKGLQFHLLSHAYVLVHCMYMIIQYNHPQVKYKTPCKKSRVPMLSRAYHPPPICSMLLLQIDHSPKQASNQPPCVHPIGLHIAIGSKSELGVQSIKFQNILRVKHFLYNIYFCTCCYIY